MPDHTTIIPDKTPQFLVDLARASMDLKLQTLPAPTLKAIRNGSPLLALIPDEQGRMHVENLSGMVAQPDYKQGHIVLNERADFVAAINDHKLPETRIFCQLKPDGASFAAIFDFHDPVSAEKASLPGLCAFTATFSLAFSPEWLAWSAILGKSIPAPLFGEFIEEREREFVAPNAATMATVAFTLRGTENCTWENATRLSNGNLSLAYKRENSASAGEDGKTQIPEDFTIRIPVFLGEEPRDFTLKLRYRVPQGHAHFTVVFPTQETVVREAIAATRKTISEATSIPVWHGTYQP